MLTIHKQVFYNKLKPNTASLCCVLTRWQVFCCKSKSNAGCYLLYIQAFHCKLAADFFFFKAICWCLHVCMVYWCLSCDVLVFTCLCCGCTGVCYGGDVLLLWCAGVYDWVWIAHYKSNTLLQHIVAQYNLIQLWCTVKLGTTTLWQASNWCKTQMWVHWRRWCHVPVGRFELSRLNWLGADLSLCYILPKMKDQMLKCMRCLSLF